MSVDNRAVEPIGFIDEVAVRVSITPDQISNLKWRTKDEGIILLKDMPDDHLRNTALMLMGMGYQDYFAPDRTKVLWLTALRIEWMRRRAAGVFITRS